jgi:hypothetical protein
MHRLATAFCAVALALTVAPAAAHTPDFRIAGDLSPSEHAATLHLLTHTWARLPPLWAEALDHPIAFTWRGDLPKDVHGRARRWSIALDRRLLTTWMERPGGARAQTAAARAAEAALLHELAHLYDRTGAGRLSRDPRLLDLAGWQVAALRPGRRSRNDFRDRSPDPYELHSPKEFVAVNLEHYLFDPDYACRRPGLAAYFDARFGWTPPARTSCTAGLLFVRDEARSDDPHPLLDPEHIHEVDYLLAEGNDRPMSRWGHSMLRLVVCAPGRPRGPDCRLDLQYHLVLSFRAFVGDLQVSSWRGLTGSYPSRLFALPLGQVIDEYTKVELRGLRSVPLALTREEIAELAGRAAQLHWGYDGRYYFISNNCAVETWKLLHDALPRLAALPLSSIRPNGLLARLGESGITADAQVPGDANERTRLGYWIAPADAQFDAMYAVARDELHLPAIAARDWLALPPHARAPALQQAGLKSAAALFVLESAALRQQETLARDELKRRWLRNARSLAALTDIAVPLQELLRVGGAFSRPATWLENVPGYGLPQSEEREVLAVRVRADAAHRRSQFEALEAVLPRLLSSRQRLALEGTEANVALISQRVRALATES